LNLTIFLSSQNLILQVGKLIFMNFLFKCILLIFLMTNLKCGEPTIFIYNGETGNLSVFNDSNYRYIDGFMISNDKIFLDYPLVDDSIKRSLINLNEYFNINSQELLKGNEIQVSINAGIKKDGSPIDSYFRVIEFFKSDSIYYFNCGR